MVQGREENGVLILSLEGKIDSSNSKAAEAEIRKIYHDSSCEAIEVDCDRLEYSTSAGLRVLLRLKQDADDVVLINVHTELYNIFEMTGFTEMMEIRKAYRVFSVDGCEVIGQGANGKVYRIDPDTIVKVYKNPDALPEISRERELARLAFVAGVPTAIPYDVVRIEGGGYGSVFELLNATSYAKLLIRGEKTPEEIAEMSVSLLKLIHSKEVRSDVLPNMRTVAIDWAGFLRDYLPEECARKLFELISAVPEDSHLLHGDYHIKNIMLQDEESLLIDMDTLCYGHPIFELASIYNAYQGFGLVDPDELQEFLGISFETGRTLWRRTLELYLGTREESVVNEVETKAKVIGLTRLMRRAIRRSGEDPEKHRKMTEACGAELRELVPKLETLVF